jgi:molecular chaperone DnaJ
MRPSAYEILSDESKRKSYDRTGSTEENPYAGFENEDIYSHFKGSGFPGGKRGQPNMQDFESIFEDLFGGGMGGGKRGRGRNSHSAPDMSEDIELKIDLEFAESVNGTSKVHTLKHRKYK